MAHINATDVRAIRNELKVTYPDFKFGVRKGYGGLSVNVTIKQGPADFTQVFQNKDDKHAQINQYHLYNYVGHEEFFQQIIDIAKTAPAKSGGKEWFDHSDAQTDYFHTAYYIDLSLGEWDSPYVQTKGLS